MSKMLVASMKRLYQKGAITKEDVAERVKSGKLTPDDYKEITGEEYVE